MKESNLEVFLPTCHYLRVHALLPFTKVHKKTKLIISAEGRIASLVILICVQILDLNLIITYSKEALEQHELNRAKSIVMEIVNMLNALAVSLSFFSMVLNFHKYLENTTSYFDHVDANIGFAASRKRTTVILGLLAILHVSNCAHI